MKVEVHELLTAPERRAKGDWRRDAVQPVVELGQRPAMAPDTPRPPGEVREHRRAVHALEHQLPVTDLVHGWHGEAVAARVLHRARLESDVTALALPVAAHDAAGPGREHVGGASAGQKFARGLPARVSSHHAK